MGEYRNRWHVPRHIDVPDAVYMVTAGTYRKKPVFNTDSKLDILQEIICERCGRTNWDLQAWVVLPNHYHMIIKALDHERPLSALIRSIHSKSAISVNRSDRMVGRRVWYNYWDTCIRSEGEYLARLKYIIQNPERHGIVDDFREYPFSSYQMLTERNNAFIDKANRFRDSFDIGNLDEY